MYKPICTLLILSLFIPNLMAQKDGFKYQGLARDANGLAISNQDIALRISILTNINGDCLGGELAYSESHTVMTSDLGLFWITVGEPDDVLEGIFENIEWGNSEFCLQVEIDPAGSDNFVDLGSSPLTSVPFALYAKTAENVNDADADPENEIQTLTLNGTSISISNGNTLDLSPILPPGGTDDQVLSLDGNTLSIEDGNTIDLAGLINDQDADPENEIQSLSLTGSNLSIEGGNSINLMSIIPQDLIDLADSIGFDTITIREVLTSIIVNGNSDDQMISLDGTNLSIEDGNTISLMSIVPNDLINLADSLGFDSIQIRNILTELITNGSSDNQTMMINGTNLSIEDGNTVNLASIVPTSLIDLADSIGLDSIQILEIITELITKGSSDDQTMTLNGTNLSIEDGNTINLASIVPTSLIDLADSIGLDSAQVLEIITELITKGSSDDQTLSLNGTQIEIEGGNVIDLASIIPEGGTDNQTLSLNGTNLTIEDGNTVNLNSLKDGVDDDDNDPENELQSLVLNGNSLRITGKNTITLPSSTSGWNTSGGDLNWTSTERDFGINYFNSLGGSRFNYRWDEGVGGYSNWSISARYAINDNIFATINNQGHIGYNSTPESNAKIRLSHENINWGYTIENKSASNPWLWYQYSDNDGANLGLAYDFDIIGAFDPGTGAYSTVSDVRVKKDIQTLDPILSNLMKLKAKSYIYKTDISNKTQFGFIAQEVEKIFPEMITPPKTSGLGKAHYTMNYAQFGVIAVKAIQEQQEVIMKQQELLDAQQTELKAIRTALEKAGISIE